MKPLFTSINGARATAKLTQETDSYIVREWRIPPQPTPTIIEALALWLIIGSDNQK